MQAHQETQVNIEVAVRNYRKQIENSKRYYLLNKERISQRYKDNYIKFKTERPEEYQAFLEAKRINQKPYNRKKLDQLKQAKQDSQSAT